MTSKRSTTASELNPMTTTKLWKSDLEKNEDDAPGSLRTTPLKRKLQEREDEVDRFKTTDIWSDEEKEEARNSSREMGVSEKKRDAESSDEDMPEKISLIPKKTDAPSRRVRQLRGSINTDTDNYDMDMDDMGYSGVLGYDAAFFAEKAEDKPKRPFLGKKKRSGDSEEVKDGNEEDGSAREQDNDKGNGGGRGRGRGRGRGSGGSERGGAEERGGGRKKKSSKADFELAKVNKVMTEKFGKGFQ